MADLTYQHSDRIKIRRHPNGTELEVSRNHVPGGHVFRRLGWVTWGRHIDGSPNEASAAEAWPCHWLGGPVSILVESVQAGIDHLIDMERIKLNRD